VLGQVVQQRSNRRRHPCRRRRRCRCSRRL